jgi:hypothetical protein
MSLINNVLLKTHLLQTIAHNNDGEITLKINWGKTILHLLILILLLIAAFILKARYNRWKARQRSPESSNFPPWNQNLPFLWG